MYYRTSRHLRYVRLRLAARAALGHGRYYRRYRSFSENRIPTIFKIKYSANIHRTAGRRNSWTRTAGKSPLTSSKFKVLKVTEIHGTSIYIPTETTVLGGYGNSDQASSKLSSLPYLPI
jgi:hypothetical protein